jgi:hypothetical protein
MLLVLPPQRPRRALRLRRAQRPSQLKLLNSELLANLS